jgi:hypothetical protein
MKNVIRSVMSGVDFAGIGVMLITYILASLVTGLLQLWYDSTIVGKLLSLVGLLPMMCAVWVTSKVCENYCRVKTVLVNTAIFCTISVALWHVLGNITVQFTVQSYYGVAVTVFMLLSVFNALMGSLALWVEATAHISKWIRKVKVMKAFTPHLFGAWYIVSLVGVFSMASIVGYAVCISIHGC